MTPYARPPSAIDTGQGGRWSRRVEVVWSNRPFTAHTGLPLEQPAAAGHDQHEPATPTEKEEPTS